MQGLASAHPKGFQPLLLVGSAGILGVLLVCYQHCPESGGRAGRGGKSCWEHPPLHSTIPSPGAVAEPLLQHMASSTIPKPAPPAKQLLLQGSLTPVNSLVSTL